MVFEELKALRGWPGVWRTERIGDSDGSSSEDDERESLAEERGNEHRGRIGPKRLLPFYLYSYE